MSFVINEYCEGSFADRALYYAQQMAAQQGLTISPQDEAIVRAYLDHRQLSRLAPVVNQARRTKKLAHLLKKDKTNPLLKKYLDAYRAQQRGGNGVG